MTKKSCETCIAFHEFTREEQGRALTGDGECRAGPPRLVPGYGSDFPPVYKHWWCLRHSLKTPDASPLVPD